MAEFFHRDPACLESCAPGRFGAPVPHAGITFSARTNLTLIDVRGDRGNPPFLASAGATLGADLPLLPNTSTQARDCDVLWLGPDQWLLIGRDPALINEQLTIAGGCLTDVSHGRAAWRISGPHSMDMLAKGCSLDLHPSVFQAGHCAQTSIAHVGVLLHRRDDGSFDLYCARSYAQTLWHWLTEAGGEYGYEVITAIE